MAPHHGLLLRGAEGEERLHAAGQLGRPVVGTPAVTFHVFLLDQHEVIFANGAAAETLYPDAEVMNALGSARASVLRALPRLAVWDAKAAYGAPARPMAEPMPQAAEVEARIRA